MSAAADARLLALCADLEERDRQRLQLDRDFEAGHDHTNEELAAVQIPWWDALDRVAGTAARTPEGVLAKAAAVRTGFVGVYDVAYATSRAKSLIENADSLLISVEAIKRSAWIGAPSSANL